MSFDPDLYNRASQRQWDDVASAWYLWREIIEEWLGDATEAMLDLADVHGGSKVLDIAAGAGGQSIAAARRGADVLAIDFSPQLITYATRAAQEAGVRIRTRVADGQRPGVAAGLYDAVICRLGFQYFADRVEGLRQAFEALRPGGTLAVMAFTGPGQNLFVSEPVRIICEAAGLVNPVTDAPGPFAFAEGRFEATAAAAGFVDMAVQARAAPLRLRSASECVRFESEAFGALREMLHPLPEATRKETWAAVETHLARFDGSAGFVGPCEILLGVARRPG